MLGFDDCEQHDIRIIGISYWRFQAGFPNWAEEIVV